MVALIDGLVRRIQEARRDHPALDRLVLTQEHYGRVGAAQQAGAVTYFGFLSVFPVLALAFFVVGWLSHLYPDARHTLKDAINQVMPGLVGGHQGQLSLAQVRHFSGWAAVFGVAGVLYAGLGWLSSLRAALEVVFEVPPSARPNFVVGKARDLAGLAVLGAILFVAVAVTGFVGGFAGQMLEWVGLSAGLGGVVVLLTVVLGLAANTLLFFVMFVLLAHPPTPRRSLWAGAAVGSVGFEVLKQLSGKLLSISQGQPAAQAFGIALILLVWINYFSRVVLYAAAFAQVSPAAREQRLQEYAAAPVHGPQTPPLAAAGDGEVAVVAPSAAAPLAASARNPVAAFLAGAGTMGVALAVLTTIRKRDS